MQCPIACKEQRNCGQLNEGLKFSMFRDVLLVPQISSRLSYGPTLKKLKTPNAINDLKLSRVNVFFILLLVRNTRIGLLVYH